MTQGAASLDFADAGGDTCTNGASFNTAQSCTVNVTFTPTLAGPRDGAVVLQDNSGNTLITVYIHGIGSGPQVSFLPNTPTPPLGGGFNSPNGVAVDASGDVFVADPAGGTVTEIPPGCTSSSSCVKTLGGGFTSPNGVAVDGAGNVFVADPGNAAVDEIPYGCTSSSCVSPLGGGFAFGSPTGVAVDKNGNVIVADNANAAVYQLPAANGYTTVKPLGGGFAFTDASGVAVDGSGNVYVLLTLHGAMYEIQAAGGYSSVVGLPGFVYNSNVLSPAGVAVDGNGNLYVTDPGTSAVYQILVAGGFSVVNPLASGLGSPSGLAVDGNGNVFLAEPSSSTVAKLDFADAPTFTFPTPTAAGTTDMTDAPQTVTVQNIGNAPLTFQAFNLLDAVLASPGAADCTLLAGSPLAAGSACTLGVAFAPAQSGPVSGYVNLVDNALNAASPTYATQTIVVLGTGLAVAPVINSGPPNPTDSTAATFTFSDTETGVSFRCSLDGAAYAACSSGVAYTSLSSTAHVFAVKAQESGGALSSAATYNWTIITTPPPPPAISSGPASLTNSTSATFDFSDGEPGVTFLCSLDGAAYTICTSPASYTALGNGAHTFVVEAMDAAGNVSTLATYNWTVNTAPSFGTVANGQTGSTVTLTFTIASRGTIASPMVLTQGAPNLDFKDAGTGTCDTNGTQYVYSAGATCTVNVTFTPQFAGPRNGAVVLEDGSGNVISTVYVSGIGTGPQVAFGPGIISTVAGDGVIGGSLDDGGPAISAGLFNPNGVAVDGSGNLYIADIGEARIRKVNAATGIITTLAGNGRSCTVEDAYGDCYSGDGGPATSAELSDNGPSGVAVDGAGNIFIADTSNQRIRKVSAATGIITTVAGNGYSNPSDGVGGYTGDGLLATSAELNNPQGVAVDGSGNLYIADTYNGCIRMVSAATGIITTVAGKGTVGDSGDGGPATSAELFAPASVALDGPGNLYIVDEEANRVRKVSAATGIITTVAGNGTLGDWFSGDGGPATSAELANPYGVALDGSGNLYIADQYNSRIRKVNAATGIITTVAGGVNILGGNYDDCGNSGYVGDGGPATSALLCYPAGVALDGAGNLYIADTGEAHIRKVDVSDPPSLTFPTPTIVGSTDTTDDPLTVTVENIGNAPLNLSGIAPSTNFTTDGGATTCSTSSPVVAGSSCVLGVDFAPLATATPGTLTGTFTLTDNSLNVTGATQAMNLSGTGLAGMPTLVSIAVTPSNPSIAKGQTQQFTATGTYSDGSTQNLTASVTWTSLTTSVATISTSGLATGVGTGTINITATLGNIVSSNDPLTVTAPTLVSIAVTPSSPSIAKGLTQQFTATGTYSDSSTQNITSTVTWASATTATATITSGGLATGVAAGSSIITATLNGITSPNDTLTVTAATLVSIAVTPSSPSIAKGLTQQFTATGTYSDSSTQNLTASVTWASATTATATITTGGLATGVAAGTSIITATLNGITSPNDTLTVTAATLVSIAVTPASPSIAKGLTQQFTATGTYSDSSTQNLTASVTWASATTATATITTGGLATGVAAGSSIITATLSGVTSPNDTLTVTAATLVSIAVTPSSPSIAKGLTQQFTATGTYSDSSTQNITSTVTWASATVSTATISSTGLATGVAAGTSNITATLSGVTSPNDLLTVTAATLVSIAVTPSNPSIAKGLTQQFTATGTYSDSSTQNLTASVTWASATVSTATIASGGLATGVAAGTSIITATLNGITSPNDTLTVTAAALVSIAVTPSSPSIAKGLTQQFTATGTYSDSSTQNLTASVTWASATTATATITTGGLATGVAAGSSIITATLSGVTSPNDTLTVTAATLVSIAVTPSSPSIAKGLTQQFTATGTYSDSSTQNLTASVTWASATTATATITTGGLATGVAAGSSIITATLSGVTSPNDTLTVTAAALVSIAVTPSSPSIAKGLTQQFTATGTYSDSTTQNITSTVTWASATVSTATISSTGLATGVAAGTSNITATLSGVTSPNDLLTVTAATLVSIAVTPSNPSIAKGLTQQFTATGTYSDSSTQNLTASVTWASATVSTATIASGGLATGVAAGTSIITATLNGITSPNDTLTVTAAALVSIAVTPSSPSIAKGLTQQFTATGTYSDSSTHNLTASVTWASATTATATITTGGLATGVAAGSSIITATLSGVTSPNDTLTVTAATLVSIAVTPSSPSIAKGLTQQFTATGTYSDSSTQNLTASVTWASATTATATITTGGLATGVAAGSSIITATLSGVTSPNDTLTVTAAALVSIAVTPSSPSIAKGLTQQFTATGTYSDSTTQNITSTVTWASATVSTATISSTGLATGVAAGTSKISATLGSVVGSTVLTVNATVQVTVGTTPAGLSFSVDGTTYTSTKTLTWTVGSSHTIATTSPQTSGGTQNTFASWSDSGALSHSVTASSGTASYTATFKTAYQLTTAASPTTGGTVSPASGTYYASGTVVSLVATANSGYKFSSWTGSVASASSASTSITMNAPQTVTASFTVAAPANFTITPIPSSETVTAGVLGGFILEINPVNGFDGNVTLNCSGGPAGSSCEDFPMTVKVNCTSYAVSGILFPKKTAAGTYTITFTGVSGSITATATAKFTVK